MKGYDRLWTWFGLSYASWLTLPRSMMHEMPDEWQRKMADLLYEFDETYTNQPDFGTRVLFTKGGKLDAGPKWLLNYRHPDRQGIEQMKKAKRSK